jgi:hypothetical protein
MFDKVCDDFEQKHSKIRPICGFRILEYGKEKVSWGKRKTVNEEVTDFVLYRQVSDFRIQIGFGF